MTLLVTGSSGFVGRAIMARLPDAIGLDPVAAPGTRVIDDLSDRARLRNLIAREKITHIIHAGRRIRPDGAGGRSGRRVGDQRHLAA
jgi:nucleoside-diphosphate-sugar epimerase